MHSGQRVQVEVLPADIDQGIVFTRTDLEGSPQIKVAPDNIREFYLGSCIANEAGAKVLTMEHFMAVLAALAITNLSVRMSGEEMPILDGSALGYLDCFEQVGVMDQLARIAPLRLDREVWVAGKDSYLLYRPADCFSISFYVDYQDPMVGVQQFEYAHSYDNFFSQLLKARTFCFYKDVEMMRDRGLALGGSVDNALVIYEDHFSTPLRYQNEPVRHKVLDLLGDLYLLGRPLIGHVVAIKSSHALNGRLVKALSHNF